MSLPYRLLSEFIGTAGLLIVVVGSGIMGDSLSQGNQAIALLANSLATGAGLFVLINLFDPISGAHFNPAVSFLEFLLNKLDLKELSLYSGLQIFGGITGVVITHTIFGQQLFQLSTHDRSDFRFMFSELIATSGLLAVISISSRRTPDKTPTLVAMYISAAYWCTSSTSFANPAVTIARGFTNTFSGIQWNGVLGFVIAQLMAALVTYLVIKKLDFTKKQNSLR